MAIRVFVSTRKFKAGPSVFRNRIAEALAKHNDIKVTRNDKDKFDVELCVVRHIHEHKKPKILRVDGCYYTSNHEKMNRNLISAMHKSNFVVFQSYFSKKMCYSILGMKPKRRCIIRNGIDFKFIDNIKPKQDIYPGSFVTSALWRDSKRPNSLAKGFLESGIKGHLYVIGEKFDKRWGGNKNIHLLGKLTHEESIAYMKACEYMIHLCFIDSCPNSVVEGLASGLNVLCTNLGGTKELVGDHGHVMDVDSWGRKMQPARKLDNLPASKVAEGIHRVMEVPKQLRSDDLNMNHVAERYVEIIKQVLGK